jgi:methionyl-tRNA formyltransferase
MRIVFFGSSDFSVPFLEFLKDQVVLVVTSPDKKRNRGKKLLPNPVKIKADQLGIDSLTSDLSEKFTEEKIRSTKPDMFVVISFGKIIPRNILSIVECAVNVHPSKLPFYRGAAPIERQLMDGVIESAVCIIKISERLDRGDIIVSKPFEILFSDTKEDVERKVIKIGKQLLSEAFDFISEKGCYGEKQTGMGSYAKKITLSDEIINWEDNAISIYNKIRALYPSPAARTSFKGKIFKIYKSEPVEPIVTNVSPGTIIHVGKTFFDVSCGRGTLRVLEVQLEGKKRMPVKDFLNGIHVKTGERLG